MKSSKNDTNYKHELDDLIIKILSERNECYKNELFEGVQKKGFSGSKQTFHRHLIKMTKANFIQYEKRGRNHYYSLTEHTKRRLEFEIKEYVKPKRRNLNYKKQIPKYDKKKIYALILLQSGAGSTQIISSSSTKNHLNESLTMIDPRYLNNNNRIRYHRQAKEKNRKRYIDINDLKKVHGVTIEDINFRRNVAYKGIFSHIEFSKMDIEDTFKK